MLEEKDLFRLKKKIYDQGTVILQLYALLINLAEMFSNQVHTEQKYVKDIDHKSDLESISQALLVWSNKLNNVIKSIDERI